ncbi:MAG: thiamine phosphate synthase, partial [Muribaculum sp.]|nr:thiamine phosphate synthase [Muribaculum sp.]
STEITKVLSLVNHAIANGIGWIQLPTLGLNETDAKKLAEAVIPACRENDVILTLENQVETVNKLHNHGVLLTSGAMHPAFVRERLGPHAIIGISVDSNYDFNSLKGVDIDYIVLEKTVELTLATEIIDILKDFSIDVPVVITGNYTPDDVLPLGIKGILKEEI